MEPSPVNALTKAQERLHAKPILTIIDAMDQVATTFRTPNNPFRHEAASILTEGMSLEMSDFVLDDLFGQLTRPHLLQLLEEELGDPLMLDLFRPKRSHRGCTRAYGPGRMTHILPGNIPGLGVMSLVFALLVKSASIAKISSKTPARGGSPSLIPIFLQVLQQIDSDLSASIAFLSSGQATALDEALHWAHLVILYGSDETLKALRPRIPSTTKTILYGPKFSIGIVARDRISRDVAEAAARDIALYDQKGCLSPHLYYVENPTPESAETTSSLSPKIFAQWVGEALDKIPPSPVLVPADTASAIQQLRGTIPLKGGTVFASTKGVAWTVLYDPDPCITLSPLSRTVFIKPIQDIQDVIAHLNPFESSIQCMGVAISPQRLSLFLDALGRLGVCRICPMGKMQEPPLTWHHDGRFRILDLLRFVDWEGDPSPTDTAIHGKDG